MKTTVVSVLFFSILAVTWAYSAPKYDYKYADKDVLYKQSFLFEFLQHPYQPGVSIFPQKYYTIAQSYYIDQNYDFYKKVDAVKQFMHFYKKGLIPFNELFSIYNPYHRDQAVALFHTFYYAKDWDTFYKTVIWARYNVNPGLFVYALNVAVYHREDFAGFEMPAIYEIFPNYFFSIDVIQRAQMYKQTGFPGVKKVDGVYNLVLYANYSGSAVHAYDEHYLSYFTEDIGLNSYYYYFHVDYPFWMGGEEYKLYKDRRGEYFFFYHQQLLARYYLERLSNNMGAIKEFSWYKPFSSFYPNLRTYYGYPFVSRDKSYFNYYYEKNYYDIEFVTTYEKRLFDAIDSGYFLLENGTYFNFSYPGGIEYLGNLLQGNPDSYNVKYYNYFYNVYKTFGKYFGKYYEFQSSYYPSVLQHPETQLRDPAYWEFMKRFFMFYYKFYDNLPAYTYKEIAFDAVKIESVETDKLITYFDYFDADISNAVDIAYPVEDHMSELRRFGRVSQYNGEDFVIKARQYRLNHVPFKVYINAVSSFSGPGVVRIYLGPKYDEYGHKFTLNGNRFNFVLLDVFKYDFITGQNVISRESREFFKTVKDRTTYYELYKYIMYGYIGIKPFPMDNYEAHTGFPNRLLLPKGKKGGQPYTLFVHISPYYAPYKPQFSTYDQYVTVGTGSGSKYVDSLPFGYPFDRKIDPYYWYTSNMYYYDVNIFHKTEYELNHA